ncbi:MAG: beta-1,6-galactofuranosyltransferase [Streptococcaceae bacterium]|nr:beta-1,6-galactofuranosyltransferase [Streptococcaceae bacterium]MCL2681533.1 beta-1,6-galactofuranosyltransferase [Streptococcaceae bacterium]
MTYWITSLISSVRDENTARALFIMSQNTAKSASELGFKTISYNLFQDLAYDQQRRTRIIKSLLDPVQPGDTVVIQYPLWITNANFALEFFDYLKDKRKAKMVGLLHDVNPYMRNEELDVDENFDLKQLRKFDMLLVANDKIGGRLKSDKVDVPMVSMHIWDYHYNGPIRDKAFKKELYFIGGRQIKELDYTASTPLTVVGRTPRRDDLDAIEALTMLPVIPSNDLVNWFDGGFGLVESQNILEKSNFNFQEYNKWNNPTKLSLYIASGLPVVVSHHSPHAEWIKEKGIGIVLDNLNEIDDVFATMTEEDYKKMLKAIEPWQRAVTSGLFIKRALLQIERVLELGFDDVTVK